MFKYLILLAVFCVSNLANAAFLFHQEKELTPVVGSIADVRGFEKAHFLNKKDLEDGLFKRLRDKNGWVITHLPQTTWDLYVLLNHVREEFRLPGIEFIDTNRPTPLNNGFIDFVVKNDVVRAFYSEGRFSEVSRILIEEIVRHLKRYNDEVIQIYGVLGEPVKGDSPLKLTMWLFMEPHFPEIKQLLVRATQIEQEAYELDQIPLWRHSRTHFSVTLEQKEYLVFDVPLYWALSQAAPRLVSGTLSYGYSLLSDFINDGSMVALGNFGPASACALSYYQTDLLNRVYEAKGLPFYVFGQLFNPQEQIADKLPQHTILSVIRFPKKFFERHSKAKEGVMPKGSSWFSPSIPSNEWALGRGEASHPRLRGTHLKRVEKDESAYFTLGIQSGEQELFTFLKKFIKSTNAMEIIALDGRVLSAAESAERTKYFVEQREAFANEILSREDAAKVLEGVLHSSHDGIDFKPPRKTIPLKPEWKAFFNLE